MDTRKCNNPSIFWGFSLREVYNYRISDHYNRTTVSLAVLADDDPNCRPSGYRDELWGWSVGMTFPAVKILDYAGRAAELEADKNPFARVVLAHLKTLETRRDPEGRRVWKFRLVRGLFEHGFKKEDVGQLFRLIDWLMELPPPLEKSFRQELGEYKERRHMPYITSYERHEIRKTMLQAIEQLLRIKFGEEGTKLMSGLSDVEDADKLLAVHERIAIATTLDEVRRAIAEAAAPSQPRKKSSRRKPK